MDNLDTYPPDVSASVNKKIPDLSPKGGKQLLKLEREL